jgi:hypothetical protein
MATLATQLNSGSGFAAGETVTATKLNNLVNTATVTYTSAGDTDDSTLEVSGNKLRVKDGGITNAKLATGILSAQSALKTDTQVGGIGAGTETDITGLSLSVVVPTATAKVLLLGYISQSGLYVAYRIKRDGTNVALGDADGNRTRALMAGGDENYNTDITKTIPISFLDAPAAAGTYVYKITGVCSFSALPPKINRGSNDANDTYGIRATSQLIALVIP